MADQPTAPSSRAQYTAGILVLLLSLAAGGAALYWFVLRDQAPANIPIPVAAGDAAPHPPHSAIAYRAGGFIVRTPALLLRVPMILLSPNQLRLQLDRRELIGPIDAAWVQAGQRLAHEPAAADHVKADAQEVQKLKEISVPNITLTADQRQNLAMLWTAYLNAPPNARSQGEKNLVAALTDIAVKDLPDIKRQLTEAVAKTRELISPQQMTELQTMDSQLRHLHTPATTQAARG